MLKRGLTYQEAMDYVGVRRRTFDEVWRPQLVAMQQGACLIFDRHDLDKLFDRLKNEAAGKPKAANDEDAGANAAHNGPRNGRPVPQKGEKTWADKQPGSTRTRTGFGKLTSGTPVSDFASAVSTVMTRRKAG